MSESMSVKTIMEKTIEAIKESIDTNTIVGQPIRSKDTTVVPISKITVGFGIGGGEYSKGYDEKDKKDDKKLQQEGSNFAGAGAGAITISPVAFVVIDDKETRIMSVNSDMNVIDNIITMTPKIIEKVQHIVNDTKKKE